jgi:hypothetical protein
MKQSRYLMVASLSALLLTAAACSKEKQSEAAKMATPEEAAIELQNPNSCALVSKAEVEQAVGHEVADPQPNPSNPAICDYKFADYGTLNFLIAPSDPRATPDIMMEELKRRKISVTEATGVGDRAFFASHGYGMIQLNAFKGRRYVLLTMLIPGATEGRQKAAAEELMRKALSKL